MGGGGDEDGVCDYVFRTWFTMGFSVNTAKVMWTLFYICQMSVPSYKD